MAVETKLSIVLRGILHSYVGTTEEFGLILGCCLMTAVLDNGQHA
jgi:hypothetical protein